MLIDYFSRLRCSAPQAHNHKIVAMLSLDDYLHRFSEHRQVTIVGPMQIQPPPRMRTATAEWVSTLEEPLIWVDGGVNYRHACGLSNEIGFAVGDGDSANHKLDQYLDTDKDYSDLAYVLSRLPEQVNQVILLGFLGARRDHELFNVGEIHHFLRTATTPTWVRFAGEQGECSESELDHSIIAYSKGDWKFTAQGVFSLAVFEATEVTLVGACKFQLKTPTTIQPLSSLGLSNEGSGEITLKTQNPAFIFQAGDIKSPQQ